MAITFERTWAFDLNRAITPASSLDLTRRLMWTLAAQLTGNLGGLVNGLWTLYASSDSSTAGTDTTDRWVLAGPYDGTKIVRGSGSNVHSWIVLQSPTMNGSQWYMILSFNSAADAAFRISFSKSAPTGGSTTATPTATDQWFPRGGTPATAVDLTIHAGTTTNQRCQFGLTSGGDFYFLSGPQGSVFYHNFSVLFMRLMDYSVNDLMPIIAAATYGATISAHGTQHGGASNNSGLFADSSGADSAGITHRHPGTLANSTHISQCAALGMNNAGSANDFTGSSLIDSGYYADAPLFVVCGTGSGAMTTIRGRLPDLAYCPYATGVLANGTATPGSGPVESCKSGNIWFPANAQFDFS